MVSSLTTVAPLLLASTIASASAFSTAGGIVQSAKSSRGLSMVPRYDPQTKRWVPTAPEDEPDSGYPPLGSLLRQGPVPFLSRLSDPDSYEQGVLKMMANDGMTRAEAQGNMDAYITNPNDWALQKLEEKNGAPKFDYERANMDPALLALTAAWTGVLLTVVGRVIYVGLNGCDDFCRSYHW